MSDGSFQPVRIWSITKKGGDCVSTFTIILIVGVVVGIGSMLAMVLLTGKKKK